LWNQIKADVLGVPYQRLSGGEFGTWGCALIAGKAAGLYTTWRNRLMSLPGLLVTGSYSEAEVSKHIRLMVAKYIEMQSLLTSFYQQP
jgi:sugar (pentulose or hexulose) kinase